MSPPLNLLIIVCDHLSPRVIGAYGESSRSATPAIDTVAMAGTCFRWAFTTAPLCQPARASLWTGLYPHQTGVRSNGSPQQYPDNHIHIDEPIGEEVPTLGSLVASAGYTAVHFGKQHDRGALRGFDCQTEREVEFHSDSRFKLNRDSFRDRHTADMVMAFLRSHNDGPFIAIADFNNPHNICDWVGSHSGLTDPLPDADSADLPGLPDNFYVNDWDRRADPVAYLCCSHPRQAQASLWSPEMFRHYLRAYRHYCGLVDHEINRVLSALRSRSDAEKTVVMILADHGDGLASHGMVTKQTAMYDQIMRVPLIVAGPGIVQRQNLAGQPLVSLLDVLPTCCDFVGIDIPADKPGRSLMPWLRGEEPAWRDAVIGYWFTEWGHTICPGRMVRTDTLKYLVYRDPTTRTPQEELYDLRRDPGEVHAVQHDPTYTETLARMRTRLNRHIQETGDRFWDEPLHVHPDVRQHPRGYAHHVGPTAVDLRV